MCAHAPRLEPFGSRAKPTAATWVIMSKKTLRQQLLNSRDMLDITSRKSASSIISQSVVTLLTGPNLKIGSYLASGSEVDLEFLHDTINARNHTLYVPKIRSATEMDLVELPSPQALIKGKFGISTSSSKNSIQPNSLDYILMPCVGFDLKGNRLGMGGGYYDRFLEGTRSGPPVRIGVAFDTQQAPDLLPDSWDQSFDWIVTETKIIRP